MNTNTQPTEAGKKDSGKSVLKKWLIRVAAAAIVLYGLYILFGYYFTYSSGYRAGKIIKFSNKGYVFKTWEGQIYLGTITPDDAGISSKYWDFSVDRGNAEIQRQIETAMSHKQEVRLHYREKLVQFSWRGETRYFVDSIEMVK